MFQYTRNTNNSPHCSNSSLCILVEFEVLATDVSDATDEYNMQVSYLNYTVL